ncbi:MAG: hypothetical protein N3A59_07405 [Thermodesulfovibrionales bacterium]|nr:hypothetical protein [Thermodesulfovibrionales bacterium]
MEKIIFRKDIQKGEFLNVFKNFAKEEFEFEVRYDPLLEHTSIYNRMMKGKLKVIFGENDYQLIDEMINVSRQNCILCDKVETHTPKYLDYLCPSGRLRQGQSVLFPNLFPIAKYHAIISITKDHFLRLSEFTPEVLFDSLIVSRNFIELVYKNDKLAQFSTLNANYLFPSGASLVHPHLQLLVSNIPYSLHKRLIEACKRYYNSNASNYFTDLSLYEKSLDERYIFQKGNWHWIASYSPLGSNEILGIHHYVDDISLLSDDDIRYLAEGISQVLNYYEKLGFLSFNFTLFSNKKSEELKGLNCVIKLITRQNLYKNYRNDDYYLQKLLQSELIITLPEELAQGLKD